MKFLSKVLPGWILRDKHFVQDVQDVIYLNAYFDSTVDYAKLVDHRTGESLAGLRPINGLELLRSGAHSIPEGPTPLN